MSKSGFDKTLDRDDLTRLDPTICDFGTFANGKLGCGNKPVRITKAPTPTPTPPTLYSYVETGYVVDGYFTTSTSPSIDNVAA